jgi:hypothetical protein
VVEDVKKMGIMTWKTKAQDRKEWAGFVRQALVAAFT